MEEEKKKRKEIKRNKYKEMLLLSDMLTPVSKETLDTGNTHTHSLAHTHRHNKVSLKKVKSPGPAPCTFQLFHQ